MFFTLAISLAPGLHPPVGQRFCRAGWKLGLHPRFPPRGGDALRWPLKSKSLKTAFLETAGLEVSSLKGGSVKTGGLNNAIFHLACLDDLNN